ncbi:hypothetical protein B0H21DRAFT_710023 [Amylocystis lapponica]|nr:hypothetical protein B0H21DRAFT_710023 [Amylocystis lapponica]
MSVDAETHAAMIKLLNLVTQVKKQSIRLASKNSSRGGYILPATTGYRSGMSGISDLPSMVPEVHVTEDEEDGDLYKQHMVVVNGWQAYAVPSSPITAGTPSLGDSSSDIDELFLPSPPDGNEGFIQSLMSAKMGENNFWAYLASFLSPLLHRSRPQHEAARIVTTPKSRPSSPRTDITMSMLGQAPSVLGDGSDNGDVDANTGHDFEGSDNSNIDNMLERVCGESMSDEDPHTMILKERLDEKESLLMDVPEMIPPTVHPTTAMFLPTKMNGLLMLTPPKEPSDTDGGFGIASRGLLKRVKGLQSLNIELSWRPFKFGATMPTDEEMAGVADHIQGALIGVLGESGEAIEAELCRRLEDVTFPDPAANWDKAPSMCAWQSYDSFDDYVVNRFDVATHELVMTRDDRRQLNGTPDDEELASSDKENTTDESCRSSKRRRFDSARDHHSDDRFYRDDNVEQDDSGIFMVTSPSDGHRAEIFFGNLAHSAEGFEGQMGDGDLFLDIDPVHQMDFAWASPNTQLQRLSPSADTFTNPNRFSSFAAAGSPEQNSASTWRADNAYDHDTFVPLSLDPGQSLDCKNTEPSVDPSALHVIHPALATGFSGYPPPMERSGGALSSVPVQNADPVLPGFVHVSTATEFLQLLGKTVTQIEPHTVTSAPSSPQPQHDVPEDEAAIFDVPEELIDFNTLVLPNFDYLPSTLHRYMASMDVIEKRGLVRCLSSQQCAVDLIERDSLGEAHLILDPDTAVLFVTLGILPSQLEALSAQLCRLSWRYMNLLVVFEAYPPSMSYKRHCGPSLSISLSFSLPVIKAVKKLRRDLSIAEAYTTKRAETAVHWAFATTVEKAAAFTRTYGELARARDVTGGAVWGARSWFDLEDQDGESDLAAFDGMNTFAASIILSQTSLDEFLTKTPEERLHGYAGLVGLDRMTRFNREFARRAEAMQLSQAYTE